MEDGSGPGLNTAPQFLARNAVGASSPGRAVFQLLRKMPEGVINYTMPRMERYQNELKTYMTNLKLNDSHGPRKQRQRIEFDNPVLLAILRSHTPASLALHFELRLWRVG
jgi:hypothetical protein